MIKTIITVFKNDSVHFQGKDAKLWFRVDYFIIASNYIIVCKNRAVFILAAI